MLSTAYPIELLYYAGKAAGKLEHIKYCEQGITHYKKGDKQGQIVFAPGFGLLALSTLNAVVRRKQ
jgi:hypothetical protein